MEWLIFWTGSRSASVLAYACGHRECWPPDGMSSKSTFATSKELSDHNKIVHNGDLGGSKPFRCALAGCEKSWKVRPLSLRYTLMALNAGSPAVTECQRLAVPFTNVRPTTIKVVCAAGTARSRRPTGDRAWTFPPVTYAHLQIEGALPAGPGDHTRPSRAWQRGRRICGARSGGTRHS